MKTLNPKHSRPKSVTEITKALMQRAAIGFLLAGGFIFGMVGIITRASVQNPAILVQLSCATTLALTFAIFWTVLSLGFYATKRWAYDGVEFLTRWGSLILARRIREQLHREEVRRAFGLETIAESQETENL